MKITRDKELINSGDFFKSQQFNDVLAEVKESISKVVWPIGSQYFSINPVKKGNGVKPIKDGCISHLEGLGWRLEERLGLTSSLRPGAIDAVRTLSNGHKFALEWETGHISSSHRSLNKMVSGMLEGELIGGILILPSRSTYKFLTDRVGNFQEIEPYFRVWERQDIHNGYLAVIEIEHEYEDENSPLIPKGTDGMAKFQGS